MSVFFGIVAPIMIGAYLNLRSTKREIAAAAKSASV